MSELTRSGKLSRLEVLIVIIVIIFFFAGVIFPCLVKIRQYAFSSVCEKNLMVIGKAMLMYAGDYDGKLPRAGGPTSESTGYLYYSALDRKQAYRLADDGSGGYGSISSSLYLLVKYEGVQPETFVCKSDHQFTFDPISEGNKDEDVTKYWDFGKWPEEHCSYSYHDPYRMFALTTEDNPRLAVCADKNPFNGDTKNFSLFNPDGDRKAIKAGNSSSHWDKGQNVLFLDGHVEFAKVPYCGLNKDNIYTVQDPATGSDIRRGLLTIADSGSANRTDSCLVNSSYSTKTKTSQEKPNINSKNLQQTAFVPTLDCNLPEHKNVIWCSTFQMAWDKFKDEFIKEPIQVIEAQDFADRLNRSQYKPENLEESSYYTAAGFVEKGIIKEIQTEMAKRFPEEPVPEFEKYYFELPKPILAYCYLKVDIGFKYPFYTYKRDFIFEDSNEVKTKVAAFCNLPSGTDPDFAKVIEQVDILYYEYGEIKNRDYFAVDLCKYTQPYQVVLALIPECNTPEEALSNIENKISAFKNDKDYKVLSKLRGIDNLIVPDVLYKLTHHYNEILGKYLGNQPWKDEDYFFFEAMQMIDFSLSKTGVVIKSEARLGAAAGLPYRIEEPRNIYFNRPFLIYAKKREAGSKPFFVMWIDNAELMNKQQVSK